MAEPEKIIIEDESIICDRCYIFRKKLRSHRKLIQFLLFLIVLVAIYYAAPGFIGKIINAVFSSILAVFK